MQSLFTPWRFSYVTGEDKEGGCALCRVAAVEPARDESVYILHRAKHHFVVLNIYPYTVGHMLIVPYEHVARLAELEASAAAEMFSLAVSGERVLEEVYHPEGINLGMNLGQCAGAGIIDHLHLHVLPRWCGDTSFVTVTGGARVMPEELGETWRKLHGRF
jgi:ATP adenylyltransferase